MKKPTPIHRNTVCSVCGLDWSRHGEKPTLETCVDLLASDLAAEKRRTAPYRPVLPNPYPVPYPYPVPALPYPKPWPYTYPQPTYTSPNVGTSPNWQLTSGSSGNYQ